RDQAARWRRRRGCFRGAFHSAGTTRQLNRSASDHGWSVNPAAIAGVRPTHFRPPPGGPALRRLSCSQQKLYAQPTRYTPPCIRFSLPPPPALAGATTPPAPRPPPPRRGPARALCPPV